MELKINPKFRDALPPLTSGEYSKLEESLVAEGCQEPLFIWNTTLIDGHNRHKICTAHGIEFTIKELSFADDDAALLWIYLHQLGRRNLHSNIRAEILGRYNILRSKKAGAQFGNQNATKNGGVTGEPPLRTREIIAKETGVSASTIAKHTAYTKALDELPTKEKTAAQAGEMTQKEVIAKAKAQKEAENPSESKPIDLQFDTITAEAKRKANLISRAIKELTEALSGAKTFFHLNQLSFSEFAPVLAKVDLSKADVDLFALRRLERCPACDASGCVQCAERRYITKEDSEAVNKILAHQGAK